MIADRPIATLPKPESEIPTATLDAPDLEGRIKEILNRHPAVGLAVGVVRNGRLEFFSGHGLQNLAAKKPITEDTVFRIASITKTFTAIAVMQLWEQGLLDLGAPANDYLRAFQLIPAKASFGAATIRHLLTHTSGIPEMVHLSHALRYIYGESYPLDEPVPTLGEYYRQGLPVQREPGTMFRYTDHNFAALGQIVEDLSGQPLDRYFREHIFDPLGMADTDLLRTESVISGLATGYALTRRGPKPISDRQWLTTAASMAYSTPRDMARYLAALLGGGANTEGRILEPTTLAMMFEPQYQPDPRVPGIGLAFDRGILDGHVTIGHEGVLPGFNSQIFAVPDRGVGVMAFTNGAHGAMLWLPAETAQFLGHVIGVTPDPVGRDLPQHPEIWREICGWYPLRAGLSDMRLRAMLGVGAEVYVKRGQLMIRILSPVPMAYRGFALHPDDEYDPYVFRIDLSKFGIGSARLVFSRSSDGQSTRVHLDLLPISLEKASDWMNPRLWAAGTLATLAIGRALISVRPSRRKPIKAGG